MDVYEVTYPSEKWKRFNTADLTVSTREEVNSVMIHRHEHRDRETEQAYQQPVLKHEIGIIMVVERN
jgi:hypothetical protein